MPGKSPLVEDLTQLKELLDSGIIHETEFAQMKKDIIEKRNIPTSNTPIPAANTTLSSGDQSGNFILLFIVFFLTFMVFFCLGFAMF
tara:strand:- start:276 stop:536 length:261 start_codon:yes stop_codon:yes gene_type:complete